MNRFDVFLVRLDPTQGSEIAKTRPCTIISPDAANQALRTLIVAPLTGTRKHWPTRVASRFGGHDGEVALDQIRAIDKSRLVRRVGALEHDEAERVSATLVEMFSL